MSETKTVPSIPLLELGPSTQLPVPAEKITRRSNGANSALTQRGHRCCCSWGMVRDPSRQSPDRSEGDAKGSTPHWHVARLHRCAMSDASTHSAALSGETRREVASTSWPRCARHCVFIAGTSAQATRCCEEETQTSGARSEVIGTVVRVLRSKNPAPLTSHSRKPNLSLASDAGLRGDLVKRTDVFCVGGKTSRLISARIGV